MRIPHEISHFVRNWYPFGSIPPGCPIPPKMRPVHACGPGLTTRGRRLGIYALFLSILPLHQIPKNPRIPALLFAFPHREHPTFVGWNHPHCRVVVLSLDSPPSLRKVHFRGRGHSAGFSFIAPPSYQAPATHLSFLNVHLQAIDPLFNFNLF